MKLDSSNQFTLRHFEDYFPDELCYANFDAINEGKTWAELTYSDDRGLRQPHGTN